jgi:hypothetical protein
MVVGGVYGRPVIFGVGQRKQNQIEIDVYL